MQDYHLKYPVHSSKCRNVEIFHLLKLLMLTNEIMLTDSVHDTLKPLGI